MSKVEVPIHAISRYLPAGTDSAVLDYLNRYHVQLTITRKRKTVLGNYTYRPQSGHHIRINGDLNPYAFLITLLHELAHLVAFQSFGSRIQAHGKEWKNCFSSLLDVFIFQKIFPSDIESALLQSIESPAASACGDLPLMRALRLYDNKQSQTVPVEDLIEGTRFKTEDGRAFIRGKKIRTRYQCQVIPGGQVYLFPGLFEVSIISDSMPTV